MKVKELFEAKAGNPATQIVKGLKGLKGVTIGEPTVGSPVLSDDGKAEVWKFMVTYKANRGVPGKEKVEIYKTTDGDWGFFTDNENAEHGTLADVLAELRDYLAHGAKFYASPAAVKEEQLTEGYEGRILRLLDLAGIQGHFENGILYVQTKSDVMKAVKAMERDGGLNQFPPIEWAEGK